MSDQPLFQLGKLVITRGVANGGERIRYLVSTNRSARRNRFEMDPHVLIFPPLTTQEE
jgi:hypothetical protein